MTKYYLDPEAERLSIALWDLARPARPVAGDLHGVSAVFQGPGENTAANDRR